MSQPDHEIAALIHPEVKGAFLAWVADQRLTLTTLMHRDLDGAQIVVIGPDHPKVWDLAEQFEG